MAGFQSRERDCQVKRLAKRAVELVQRIDAIRARRQRVGVSVYVFAIIDVGAP